MGRSMAQNLDEVSRAIGHLENGFDQLSQEFIRHMAREEKSRVTIESEMKQVRQDITEIKTLLQGVAEKTQQHDDDLQALKGTKKFLAGWAAGAGLLAAIIIDRIKDTFQ